MHIHRHAYIITIMIYKFVWHHFYVRIFISQALNQIQRHAVLRRTKTISSDPDSLKKLQELLEKEDLLETIKEAEQDVKGEAAKSLLKTVLPLLKSSGTIVPFSAAERAAGISQIMSMVASFGMPAAFYTFRYIFHNLFEKSCELY